MTFRSSQRHTAEFAGTALLVCAVVGSGIMAERLAGGNVAIALLANAVATGAVLYAAILVFGPVSGAHFNPLVTVEAVLRKAVSPGEGIVRAVVQALGAVLGAGIANSMFGLPLFTASQHVRTGSALWLAEIVATFGLLTVIRLTASPAAIACYIVGAYWFTASTSFANPAVTLGRAFTDTFSGIRPVDVPGFIAAQAAGGALAIGFTRWLSPDRGDAL